MAANLEVKQFAIFNQIGELATEIDFDQGPVVRLLRLEQLINGIPSRALSVIQLVECVPEDRGEPPLDVGYPEDR